MQELAQKTCKKCLDTLPISHFYKDSSVKSGYRSKCKKCVDNQHTNYVKNNREKVNLIATAWRNRNWEAVKKKAADYKKLNRARYTALQAERRARQLQATPSWANLKDIERVYIAASNVSKSTKIKHHVDHIIPLQGENICGLHIFNNLCIIPAKMNLQKGNTF